MAIKKTQLYSSLWKSADELRGGMDASQYKDYVLVMLFVKYVSDKYAGQPDALIQVPEGGGFADMVALKGNKDIGDKINKIIGKLAEANQLKGVIDVADFNDPSKLGRGKEMVERLSNLVAIFENPELDFSQNRAGGDDLLGDAYEYLMRNFATQSGKSKGQFYTPAEVSRIMAKVIGIDKTDSPSQTIYDPTCGSGSLLLKAADEAPHGVSIYGQERDNATAGLARMNMILHDDPTAEIWQDNTLSAPHFKNADGTLKRFDFAVANPPFSDKAWSSGINPAEDEYGRFEFGIPPKKNGDYAFLSHLLHSLKSTGKGAIILPHGVLFRGNVEAEIRKEFIRRGYIKGIIGLPPNLFYGTGIPACIIVLEKEHAAGRKGIFMIDASRGFMKDGNKNRLRHQDIHKIVDVFTRQLEIPKYSRLVPLAEIGDPKNDYNLNIPRYIDSAEPEDLHDIEAHLLGGIPNRDIDDLARFWEVFPSLRGELFEDGDRPGYSELRVPAEQVRDVISANAEFAAHAQRFNETFEGWKADNVARLKGIEVGMRPKELISEVSESLLAAFAGLPLVDKYDVYQHLMTYWSDTMQDDVYLIAANGWYEASQLRLLAGKNGEKADLVIKKRKYKADLVPPSLIVERYFAAEQQAIDDLETEKDAVSRQMEELAEEHSGEESLLEEVVNDKGNITKGAVKARMKEIGDDAEFADELEMLNSYVALLDRETALKKQIKEAQQALDGEVFARYKALTEGEAKVLVVDDKWLAASAEAAQSELGRLSQRLSGRVKNLEERYNMPLPRLSKVVADLEETVGRHLEAMGYAWN